MARRARAPAYAGPALLSALAALAALLAGYGITRLPARTLAMLPHWILIALLGCAALATIAWAIRTDELLAPLGVIALTTLVYFVIRPLELSLSAGQLLHSSYDQLASGTEVLDRLPAQEISLYVHSRMLGTLEDALTRALLGLVLFYGCVLGGYRLGVGRRLAASWSRLGATSQRLDVRWVIAAWLAIGLAGQALIFVQIGGFGSALSQFSTQGNLAFGFVYLVLLNCYTAGLILWACWHQPEDRRARLALMIAVAELAGFYLLLGSRTLVIVPILLVVLARHELGRPWRLGALALAAVAAILFSSAYLSLREGARERPIGQALADVPAQAVKARAILGASPVFDQFLIATNYVPAASPYRYGGELGQALLGQVPSFVYPGKPEANDTSFRKLIWGDRFLAGRPIGAAGAFYRDFGLPGIALGALLFGVLARALTGLRSRTGGPEGRELRSALFVLAVLETFIFTIGGYSLAFGYAITIGMPTLLGVAFFARPR